MKNTSFLLLATVAVSFIGAPFLSFAATTTPTTSGELINEGSSESGSVRRERIRGWRQQSGELQQKIDLLGSIVVTSVAMPVLFGVAIQDISPNFGDPRSGGRTHEGEDIMATDGTPIVSPTPAVVLRTGSGSTEGNYVYTANPGGETFVYMHLNHVGEGVVAGAVLETGALIGYVGNTGNASGGPAHLHFEIHTGSRTAVDPFPRLTREFTPEEKIAYLSKILNQTSDPRALAQFLVSNFRATFKTALANNISVPTVIVEYLASLPEVSTTSRTATLPAGDVALGSTGATVIELQKYLIAKASGVASSRLAVAGATGYFGAVTESALIEYQKSVGITPATGYFGPATRAIVGNLSLSSTALPVVKSSTPLTRDLYKNLTGEDVRTLQKTLNRYGNIVAISGVGSPGNESTYFGPATEKAVIAFQIAHNIKPSVGYVGLITRTALLALG